MTKREDLADAHQLRLTAGFGQYLDAYDVRHPFDRKGQLSGHVRTIQLRRDAGSGVAAVDDERFRGSLYSTLQAWGIGVRGSIMVARTHFDRALRDRRSDIAALDGLVLGTTGADNAEDALWSLVRGLGIVENDASLVPHSKALHHILPDLVVPMDRAYTRPFLGWHGPQFQYQQERVFRDAFRRFAAISRTVRPEAYVGTGWRSSATKIIDNAVVGFVLTERVRIA